VKGDESAGDLKGRSCLMAGGEEDGGRGGDQKGGIRKPRRRGERLRHTAGGARRNKALSRVGSDKGGRSREANVAAIADDARDSGSRRTTHGSPNLRAITGGGREGRLKRKIADWRPRKRKTLDGGRMCYRHTVTL